MTDRTACIYCDTIGFVRWENVIRGGTAYREFFCGRCQRSWRVDEGGDRPNASRVRNADERSEDDGPK